jgi:AcrR family transcriptional regulator
MSVRDPEATKSRLMQAARREFSAKGIAGARVDAIVDAARVNKRMLYHYFESKEGLFRTLLKDRLTERAARLADAHADEAGRLSRRYGELVGDVDHVRLLMWEALELGSRPSVPDEDQRNWFYQQWVDKIAAAQQAGDLPDDLDPAQLALAEMALVMFPVAFPQLTRLVTGNDVNDPKSLEDRRRFLDTVARRLDAPRDSRVPQEAAHAPGQNEGKPG